MNFNKKIYHAASVILGSFFLLTSCNLNSVEDPDFAAEEIPGEQAKIAVFVSILPLQDFVEKIGAEQVIVKTLVQPGSSPVTYEPTFRQMKELSEAKVFFRIGVPFEEVLLAKISDLNPELTIIDLRQNITLREMATSFSDFLIREDLQENQIEDGHHLDHDADNHAEHQHYGKDPHIWLAPDLVKIQAATIAAALTEIKPSQTEFFAANLQKFQAELTELAVQIQASFAELETNLFLVFHPAWGYFAESFGLQQIPIELMGKEPSMSQVQRIIDFARRNEIKVIFVQKQFSQAHAQAIATQIGASIVELDPLAQDYLANLRLISETIATNLAAHE